MSHTNHAAAQRDFGRLMAEAEAEAEAQLQHDDSDLIDAPPRPARPDARPLVVIHLEAAARSLRNFHHAADRVTDQMRIASLLGDAEAIAPTPAIAVAIAHVRRTWSTYTPAHVLQFHKNLDTANMVRGIELVAWATSVAP